MVNRLINALASLKLAVVCLGFAVVLVFVGTIAQVDVGIYAAQARYFRSFFVYWSPAGSGFKLPVLPGGYLLGALLVANLLTAQLLRSGLSFPKIGLILTHLGLGLLLVGQLATDVFQVESSMRLREGQQSNYSEDQRLAELAILDVTLPDRDQVVAIPESRLTRHSVITEASLPFAVKVLAAYPNSQPRLVEGAPATGMQGVGQKVTFESVPKATRTDARDIPAATVELEAEGKSLGIWWVSGWLGEPELLTSLMRQTTGAVRDVLGRPQTLEYKGKTYRFVMRPARYYKPFALELLKFSHDKYIGTEIPKNFSSRVKLTRPDTQENREVLIYMNNPLRYGGETYYQSGFDPRDNKVTILQVVRNPGWLTPYVSCGLVGLGLTLHFGLHLRAFLRQRAQPAKS
jgi:hypothetical protein